VLGLVAGFVAKLILPGDDPGGFIVTAIIGIVGGVVGGVVGGFVGSLIGLGGVDGRNIGSIILVIVGAMILLIGYRMVKKKA
jgi:uncharacterized membrane protein YeaQ/YmgE (transglycosylase-associated protein family)